MATLNQEIKEAIKEKKIVIGSRTVMKGVKRGIISNIIYASNCPDGTKKDLEHYSNAEFVAIRKFDGNSMQLGEICGKPFNVLLVGITK